MKQVTEEEFNKWLILNSPIAGNRISSQDFLSYAKENGWIKESALDRAREYYNKFGMYREFSKKYFHELHVLYEAAIKEIRQGKND